MCVINFQSVYTVQIKSNPATYAHKGNIKLIYIHQQVPYNVAFKNKTSEDVQLLVVDSIVDVIFFIDIGKYI